MKFRGRSQLRDAVDAYVRRARVLRQIQSNKAHAADQWERGYLVVTVVIATVVSVIGFAGAERIASFMSAAAPVDEVTPIVESIFNIAVLLILVATLVGLVFRYGERANRHYRSLEVLTDFMRDCTDQVAMHDSGVRRLRSTDLDIVRTRYKGILTTLPPSTDGEYEKAKADDARKRNRSETATNSETTAAPPRQGRPTAPMLLPRRARTRSDLLAARRVADILAADARRTAALRALDDELGSLAWIAGGFVREAVWDSLAGLPATSPRDDVDVIYFDPRNTTKDAERAMQDRLGSRAPLVRWSVKNQARMHHVNGEEAYASLEDAIARYPETASAVAVQIRGGRLRILAPVGLEDLIELRLRRNPSADRVAFERRRPQIESRGRWSLLEVID